MSEETKDLVVKWWTQETRVSPNRKDTVQKWISPKTYETHCTHYLLETQVSDADSLHSNTLDWTSERVTRVY